MLFIINVLINVKKFLKQVVFTKWGAAIIFYLGSVGLAYYQGRHIATAEIQRYEQQIKDLNARKVEKQVQILEKIRVEYKTRIEYRDKIRYINDGVIQSVPSVTDSLSYGLVYTHNQAASNLEADASKAVDSTASKISDIDLLRTVNQNYAICYGYRAEIDAWREWYKLTKKNYEETEKLDENR